MTAAQSSTSLVERLSPANAMLFGLALGIGLLWLIRRGSRKREQVRAETLGAMAEANAALLAYIEGFRS